MLFSSHTAALKAVLHHKTHNTGIYVSFAGREQRITHGGEQWTEEGIKIYFGQLGKIASCRVAVDADGFLPSFAVIHFGGSTDV